MKSMVISTSSMHDIKCRFLSHYHDLHGIRETIQVIMWLCRWLLMLHISSALTHSQLSEQAPGGSLDSQERHSMIERASDATIAFINCDSQQKGNLGHLLSRIESKLFRAYTAVFEASSDIRQETRLLRNFGSLGSNVVAVVEKWINTAMWSMRRGPSIDFEIICHQQQSRCSESARGRDGQESPMSGYSIDGVPKHIVLVRLPTGKVRTNSFLNVGCLVSALLGKSSI